jgi:hypothetical protein
MLCDQKLSCSAHHTTHRPIRQRLSLAPLSPQATTAWLAYAGESVRKIESWLASAATEWFECTPASVACSHTSVTLYICTGPFGAGDGGAGAGLDRFWATQPSILFTQFELWPQKQPGEPGGWVGLTLAHCWPWPQKAPGLARGTGCAASGTAPLGRAHEHAVDDRRPLQAGRTRAARTDRYSHTHQTCQSRMQPEEMGSLRQETQD